MAFVAAPNNAINTTQALARPMILPLSNALSFSAPFQPSIKGLSYLTPPKTVGIPIA